MLAQKLKIRKIGNSQGVILPSYLVEALKLDTGSEIEAWIYDGVLILCPPAPTLQQLVNSVPNGESFIESKTGKAEGNEV